LMLAERGRVALAPDAATWVRRACQAAPFREAPQNREVAFQSRAIHLVQQDTAEGFFAATALVADLTLVAADARLLPSHQIPALALRDDEGLSRSSNPLERRCRILPKIGDRDDVRYLGH